MPPPVRDKRPYNFLPPAFLEALLLYCVLFLSGALRQGPSPGAASEAAVFSMGRELLRIAAYNLPALALLGCLWRRNRALPLPGRGDLLAFLWALPSLILTGIAVSLAAARFPGQDPAPGIGAPGSAAGMVVMFFSCLSTGYLEESYFRYYLGEKFREMGLGAWAFVPISSVLFALCHFYEGPWGTMNAALAALILALIYIRFRCLHGLALAHGLYNAVVYLTSRGTSP